MRFRSAGGMLWIIFPILIFPPQIALAQVLLNLNFEGGEIGRLPAGWSSRDQEKMVQIYTIRSEGENRFLHADARGTSVQIGYEKKWSLKEFPILRWRWRAQIFPGGSDERSKDGNDSVLAVYVVFGGWPVPNSIKYIWSDTLPAGSIFDSPHSGKTKVVVVRSGRAMAGQWMMEERDALADYRRIFGGGEKEPEARGIALLTDADNTDTRASGDYDDITVLRKQ